MRILGKIKKKHIFLALLAVIVLGGLAKAYSALVGTTRIAFLNYQAIALGQISHANDNAMIKLSEITTDDFDHLDDYDVSPSELEVPDISRADIEQNGLDISKSGKQMLACVTFVNNKLFVDAINHNSRAIGEHSKVVLDFYLSLLKDAIYGNEKDK